MSNPNEQPVIADLRKFFSEKEISPGKPIFEVANSVPEKNHPLTAFIAKRHPNFVAEVMMKEYCEVDIICYDNNGRWLGSPHFNHCYPYVMIHDLRAAHPQYQKWLSDAVIATLKFSEEIRCNLSKPQAEQPSLAGD